MLLLVRLLLALHLCGAVCASRNRIRHPGPASSAPVWPYSNSSIASSTSSSTNLPTSSPVVDLQTDPVAPATSSANGDVTSSASVISLTPVGPPTLTPANTSVDISVYAPVDAQSTALAGNGSFSESAATTATSVASQSPPIGTVNDQTYPTLTDFSLSTPYYGAGTANTPIGTGTPAKPTYVKPSNGSCGCTVNVRDAEIGYWYSLDQYYQIVTFYSKTSGSRLTWDYVTATTTFDLVQSVQDGLVSYEITSAWDPYLNQTTIDFVAITLPMPAAATTTVSSLSEVLPIPTTPLTQENILDDLYTEPPPASVAFTGASSTVFVAASGTPYVAYSSYEVESFEPVTDAYGKVSCRSSVTAYNLSAPYAFEYNGDKLGSSAEASGPIPEGFLQQIPQSTCVAGSYRGPVTIIYIVHVIYGSRYTPFIGHVESSIDQLEVPTLIEGPSSISRPKAHVETTVELEPPKPVSTSHEAAASRATVTPPASRGGDKSTTALPTRLSQNEGSSKNDNGGGLGAIISAVVSQVASGNNNKNQNSGSESGSGGSSNGLGGIISAVVSQAASGTNSQNGGSNIGSNSESSSPGAQNGNSNSGAGTSSGSRPGADSEGSGSASNSNSGSSGSGSQTGSFNADVGINPGSGSHANSGGLDSASDSNPGSGSSSASGSDRFDGSLGLQNGGSGSSPPVIVAGTQTATMDSSSGFVIGDQTLSPGGPAVTVEGTVLSLSPSATAIVINGQTSSLFGDPSIGGQQGVPELGKPPIVTVGSIAYTANAATQYYLAPGQTLTAGGVATIQGTVVSLGPSASYVVINGATQTFPSALITPAPNPAFAAGEAPAMVIAGQTLRPGSSIVISGTTIALDSGANNLVVNGVTRAVRSGVGVVGQPVITVAGTIYPAADGTSFVIGNQILTPGGYIVVDGNTVSLDASDRTIYINGVASSLGNSYPFSTVRPVLTISGTKYVLEVVGNGFEYVIQGQTLSPGGSIVLDGTKTISLAPGATALVVNGIAQGLTPGIVTNLEDIVVGGSTLTGVLGPGKIYIIDGQTLTIGGSVVVDGTVVSFPSESAIVINGVTQTLFGPGILTNAPDLTIAGTVYTDLPGPGTAYVIAGSTLTPGGIITVDGTIISLSPSATALVVNGVTETLFPATAIPGSTRFPVLTIDGQVYTAVPNSGAAGATYVIGGQTLTLGGSIVVDGTIISLSPSATVLVIDGQTQTLVSASTTQAQASAPSRTSMNVGATASATAAATGAVPTGAAGRATNGAISSLFLSGLLVLIGGFLL
ncbi:hypothetical protein MPH_10504 [Macrophomina phaseolina MS6]|uniref:Uncharacterized protein n=1 Tax=Macrophomina phaseolina (strain MS6) TaxID=1126212 RepID=K2RHN0_MACPH|nr:hypothetical protein MPH_10504 [Macrophomina phaseolina MS6]